MEKDAELLMSSILFGGCKVGFNTNPETENHSCFIEINNQKLVCLAQGGECRYNHKYYSPGLNDKKSWTTPIIDESCPNRCCFKSIVCDDHGGNCETSITYYPEYNKFYGLFKKYCREFEKFGIKDGMNIKVSIDKKTIKRLREDPNNRGNNDNY